MNAWPEFPVHGWEATRPTLHRWTQIVGKIRLALTPPVNHYWHSTLYVSSRGLTTSAIPYGAELFEIEFDFVDHQLAIGPSWTTRVELRLRSQSVAHFYAEIMDALRQLGIDVHIWTTPVEVPDRTPFNVDVAHATYDPTAAHTYWRALVQAHRVFSEFRGRFLGKCSPVHFFWGGLDLAVTRFSGRRAGPYTGASPNVHPHVMHESYFDEVSSAGFWPGDDQAPPMFYSYAAPAPVGFRDTAVLPAAATYNADMGEFILPYARVESDTVLLDFLQSTYEAAANAGNWDRELLERRPPCSCDRVPEGILQGGGARASQ